MLPAGMDVASAAVHLRSGFQYMSTNAKLSTEIDDTYATRLMLEGYATGAIGAGGLRANTFIDYDDDTLVARARDPRYASDFARVQVSPLVVTAVNDFMAGGGHQVRLTTPTRVVSALTRDAETTRVAIEHGWEGVLAAAAEARKSKSTSLVGFRGAAERIEVDVPAMLEERLGGMYQAYAAKQRLGGMPEPQISYQLDQIHESEMSRLNDQIKALHRRAGEVIEAAPAVRNVALTTMVNEAEAMIKHSAADLERAMSDFADAERDAAVSASLLHAKTQPVDPTPPGAWVPKFPDEWRNPRGYL